MAIPIQAMNPARPLMLTSQLYATPSPIREVRNAARPKATVAYSPLIGMPRLLTLRKHFGACPALAIAYSIRVATYTPELPEERTEVRSTAFIREAAPASPSLLNTRVNGLMEMLCTSDFSRFGSV